MMNRSLPVRPAPSLPRRVLLTIHHRLDPDRGAPGVTLALGSALAARGCEVQYFAFDHAFGAGARDTVRNALLFPWALARHLAHHAHEYDVVDASTGDAWVWLAVRGRAGAGPAIVTRSHGLEQVVDASLRESAARGQVRLSWKYPLYHGGYRLREVAASVRHADRCVLLNSAEREAAVSCLGVAASRIAVVPNGIPDHFSELVIERPQVRTVMRLAFIGQWIERKGINYLVHLARELHAAGEPFELHLLGTSRDESEVRLAFPDHLRQHLTVVQSYRRESLPSLVEGCDVLIHLSRAEGFSLALVEGMACGLVPVCTATGGAPDIIAHGQNGFLVRDNQEVEDAVATLRAIVRRAYPLVALQDAARRTARALTWSVVAERTLAEYQLGVTVRQAA